MIWNPFRFIFSANSRIAIGGFMMITGASTGA